MVRRRAFGVAFATSAALVLLLSAGLAAADGVDADGDGVPDATERATQRIVVAEPMTDEMNIISSRLVGESLEDQFRVSYKAGTFEIWYHETAGGEGWYELELRRLVEWIDPNQNGRIDAGEVVNSTELGSSAFGDVPILHANRMNPDGGRVFTFIAPSRAGDITLTLSVAERFMRLPNQRILAPMEVKMDIAIDHTFSRAAVSLGIEMRMKTEGRFDIGNTSWATAHGFAASEGAVNVTARTPDRPVVVFFSWAKTAVVGGQTVPVNVTSAMVDDTTHELYFAYPMGALQFPSRVQLLHDPALGVESPLVIENPAAPRGDALLYVFSLAGVAALVASTVLVAQRRARKRKD